MAGGIMGSPVRLSRKDAAAAPAPEPGHIKSRQGSPYREALIADASSDPSAFGTARAMAEAAVEGMTTATDVQAVPAITTSGLIRSRPRPSSSNRTTAGRSSGAYSQNDVQQLLSRLPGAWQAKPEMVLLCIVIKCQMGPGLLSSRRQSVGLQASGDFG